MDRGGGRRWRTYFFSPNSLASSMLVIRDHATDGKMVEESRPVIIPDFKASLRDAMAPPSSSSP